MFCDKCGENLEEGDIFCNNCGNTLINEVARESKVEIINSTYNKKYLLNTKMVVLLIFTTVSVGYLIYGFYTKAQEQIQKTQIELTSLKQSTNEAISAQKKLIEQQDSNISKQGDALKKSQADEALLRKALEDSQKSTVSNNTSSNSNQSLIASIAPSVVKIYCVANSYSNDIQQGSGILYYSSNDSLGVGNYYVRTNLHVVSTSDNSQSKCVILAYPDYQSSSNYKMFKSNSYKFYNSSFDIAFLTPQLMSKSENASAGTVNDLSIHARNEGSSPICDTTNIGDHLSVLGYPGVGGDTLTVTDGIISGFEFNYGVRYVKTSAKIDHGNSGGIAIEDSGCIIGIPTFVEQGSLESIGRILDLNYLFNVSLR